MRMVSFVRRCVKCGKGFDATAPYEEFEKFMKEREMLDNSFFEGTCDDCKG